MERTEKTLKIKMKGELKEINSYCSAIGELANRYDLEVDFNGNAYTLTAEQYEELKDAYQEWQRSDTLEALAKFVRLAEKVLK